LLGLSVLGFQGASVTYERRTSNLREISAYLSERSDGQDFVIIAPDYLASTFNYYFDGPQDQVAFPSTFGRVKDITWVGWLDHWENAAQRVEPTLRHVAARLEPGARIWFIAPLGGYPNDPYFSQIRVLKDRLDAEYGSPEVVDWFVPAVESAEVYVYDQTW
jgi:hypothetical protein